MEPRGNASQRSKSRLAISRKSCDQCRSRKIGCDRGSPCSNCSSARLECTHSAIASHAASSKQRILVSAEYERKIDDLARNVDQIKTLLEHREQSQPQSIGQTKANLQAEVFTAQRGSPSGSGLLTKATSATNNRWEHSTPVADFIKAVSTDQRLVGGASEIKHALDKLVEILERPSLPMRTASSRTAAPSLGARPIMPPVDAVVDVIRWAKVKALEGNFRINWVAEILPLQVLAENCQKVCFAIDDYTDINFILANAFLSHAFAEHVVVTKNDKYMECFLLCQENMETALQRLPLLDPVNMQTIAALTFGAFNAVENSKATLAWTFISTAANMCQTLGYHRAQSDGNYSESEHGVHERLFWTVYQLEKSLSLRLGRASSIRDEEITLPMDENERASIRLARAQGQTYELLYSVAGLAQCREQRESVVASLAYQIRSLVAETDQSIQAHMNQSNGSPADPMRVIYLYCYQMCQFSLLAMILRASPTASDSGNGISEDCLAVARETLKLHQRCLASVQTFGREGFTVVKYIGWAITNTPFVAFNILFTNSVRHLDLDDLTRIEGFAASIRPENTAAETITHPSRLYELLCKTARIYIEAQSSSTHHTLSSDMGMDMLDIGFGSGAFDLSDWFQENQQMMHLSDETVII